jgi:lipopolysaccharide/colanic/teichoic acid biosynthesis glycosyltransferase
MRIDFAMDQDAPRKIETYQPIETGEGRRSNGTWYLRYGKRSFDLALATTLLLLLSPLLLLIMISIRLTSKGPALFGQPRVGYRKALFTCWKFRTMYLDQSSFDETEEARRLASEGVLLKRRHDPRITRVGSFLRKYSLDEIPQLFNVFIGNMSFVGPRPLVEFMVAPFPTETRLRSEGKPGITGLWQITARNENTSVLQMLEYDNAYLGSISFSEDLRIIACTIPVVLFAEGAG